MKMLKDQVAIITGAASGIGRAAALLYAQEGAKVVVSDVDEKQGNEVTDEIKKAGGEAMFFKADISSAEDNQKLVDAAIQEYGKLDIAVNNAGIGGPLAPTAEYPLDGWQNVINTNLSGVFLRYALSIASNGKSWERCHCQHCIYPWRCRYSDVTCIRCRQTRFGRIDESFSLSLRS